jgi:hypothetical protein
VLEDHHETGWGGKSLGERIIGSRRREH